LATFPRSHWRKIWSNNPVARLNKEVKRRFNVVGIFPNDRAAMRVIGAVLAGQHDEWVIARRYLSESSMARLNEPRDTALDSPNPRAEHTEDHTSNPTTPRDSVIRRVVKGRATLDQLRIST